VQSRTLTSDPSRDVRESALLNPDLADGSVPDLSLIERTPPRVIRVAIPRDITAVQSQSLEHAGRWRRSTRRAFQWALQRGYAVRGVYADGAGEWSYYVLASDASRTQER
jgi:predicted GNAT superfamily acetyltransferase